MTRLDEAKNEVRRLERTYGKRFLEKSLHEVGLRWRTLTASNINECPSCKRMFVDGETCSRGGCPMGGDV